MAKPWERYQSAPQAGPWTKYQQPTETEEPIQPKERLGFVNAFIESAKTLGLADEAAAYAANPTDENRRALIAAGESKFQSAGGFGKGENWEAFKELLGGSLGQLVAPAAAATVGSVTTTPLGGIAAGYGTATAQYTTQNLLRQAQEQERALAEGRAPEETSAGKAAVAGAASAGLDYVQFRTFRKLAEAFPFTRNLVTPEKEVQEEAVKSLITAAREGTLKSTARGTVEGAAKGVAFEVPQEVAQTALERWQAGLSLTDDEAKEEFKQAAIGAAVLGPVIGGGAGALGARADRAKAEELVRKEDEAALQQAQAQFPAPLNEQPPKIPAEEASLEARQEPEKLNPKEIQDEILRMESVQAKRADMLSDLDALREETENRGEDFDEVLERLRTNFDNDATRIDIFSKRLEALSTPADETQGAPMAPIPQTAAAQQVLIDPSLAKTLNLPGADTAPKDQPFVYTGPVAPIPQVAGAQQTLPIQPATTAVAEPTAPEGAPEVAPIPQTAAAQQALPIQATETVEDPLYQQAVDAVIRTGEPVVSTIQSALKVKYAKAAEFLNRMELEGVVSKADREGRRQITMGQRKEAPSATAEISSGVAEQAQPEPVGGGVALPPQRPEPEGQGVAETPSEGLGDVARVAGDAVQGEGRVEPALAEKTSDELFTEIEGLKKQALSLLVGKDGRRPAQGSPRRREYDALQTRIAELTGQWGRQSEKERAAARPVEPVGDAFTKSQEAEAVQPLPQLQGVDINDLGNAIGKAVKNLPFLTRGMRRRLRRILDSKTISDNMRTGIYTFLSLPQQAQLFAKELPGLRTLITVVSARAGALKARREVLDRNVRRWGRILREHSNKIDEFNEIASESSRLQIQFKSAAFANHPLTKRFNALPPELKKIYWEMLKSYDDMADEYIKLVTKHVSKSAAAQFKAEMAKKRLAVYLPLYREGNYWLRYQNAKNETVVEAFESDAERQDAIEEAKASGATGFQEFARIDEAYSPEAVGPFFDKVVKELEAAGVSPQMRNALYGLYLSQIPASSVRQQFRKREGYLGYEKNVLRVYATVGSRMVNQLSNLEYLPEIDKAYSDVQEEAKVAASTSKSQAIPNLMTNLELQMDYIRDPVNHNVANGLASFSYYWYIIGNVSTALINLSQVPMVVFPLLSGRFPGKAGDALVKAKDIYMSGGWDNDISGEKRTISDWSFGVGLPPNSPLGRLYDVAVMQGAIRRSVGYDVVQGRQDNYTESDYVGKKVLIEQGLGWVFQNSERFNREVTLIAAFNLELEKNGGDVNAAIQFAIDTVNDAHGVGLTELQPRAFQSNFGKVAFVFKNFAQTQIFLQSRLFQQAFKGETPEVRKIAAKQFLGIMGMAFIFAGVQGLPFYGAGSVLAGLLEAAFGDDDNPIDRDEFLRQSITSLAYKGPLSQLLQVDIASRTGFNNLLWRDDDKRVEDIGPFLFAAEQLFGASYAVMMSFYRAYNDFMEGHTYRGVEAAMPSVIRNGLKAWRFTQEGAKTRDGDTLVKDFDKYNLAMQAMGFSPLEFAEKSTAAGKIAAKESALDKRKQSVYQDIYLAYKNKDQERLKEALEAKDRFNNSPAVIERGMVIKDEDIRQSIRGRERRAAQSIYGIYVPLKSQKAYDKFKPEGYDET
jgi:hypothetical protein